MPRLPPVLSSTGPGWTGLISNPSGFYGGGYFICKNSWGTGWGEDGFFKVGYSQVSQDMRFGDDSHIYFYGSLPPPLTPPPEYFLRRKNDFNGDGRTTIAVFRRSSGLWAFENGERLYFGKTGDMPVIE